MMVDARRYLPFDREPLRELERRFGQAVAVPATTPAFEPAGVGHYAVDGTISYIDVFVFDRDANRRSDAWHWPRVRTERIEPSDDPRAALERAALEFVQAVLRGDSIDEDVMLAVEVESERRLRESPRSEAVLSVDGRPARCHRITWGAYWFTSVDVGDPRVVVMVLGPEQWAPALSRGSS